MSKSSELDWMRGRTCGRASPSPLRIRRPTRRELYDWWRPNIQAEENKKVIEASIEATERKVASFYLSTGRPANTSNDVSFADCLESLESGWGLGLGGLAASAPWWEDADVRRVGLS